MGNSDIASQDIGFIGLGIMGAAMAANLARAGYRVSGWNRTAGRPGERLLESAGARVLPSLEEAVKKADLIFTCLGDESDVLQVLTSVAEHAHPGAIVIDTTTIGPAAAKLAGERLDQAGIGFLDAPITGGDVGAREGTLTIMVGGNREHFELARSALGVIGSTVEHCGPTGSGQALKLCNQVLCAVNMIAVSEALTLAESLGVDQDLVVSVLGGGAGGSWALSNLGGRIVRDDLKPGFMLKHMIKDLRLIRDNTKSSDLSLPGTAMAEETFRQVASCESEAETALGTQAMIRAYRRIDFEVV